MLLDEKDYEILMQASKLTRTNYHITKLMSSPKEYTIRKDNLISLVEDLISKIEDLQEKIKRQDSDDE